MSNLQSQITFNQARPFILADIEANLTPALLGIPGIGKSEFLKSLAKSLNTRVFSLAINQLADRADLTGARMIQDPTTKQYRQAFFPHAVLKDAIEYATQNPNETPIIFLDEFNRTTPDVTSAIFTFITDRTVGSEQFPPNIRFVVAGNDSGNVASIDDASVTRLSIYRIKPDIETFLAVQEHLNPYIEDVLRKEPNLLCANDTVDIPDDEPDDDNTQALSLFDNMDDSQFKQKTVPRTITYASRWLNTLGLTKTFDQKELTLLSEITSQLPVIGADQEAEDDLLLTGLIGHIGNTDFARALYTHIVDLFRQATSTGNVMNAMPTVPSFVEFRPESLFVDSLRNAKNIDDIESVVTMMKSKPNGDNMLIETLLWAVTTDASADLHNADIATALINTISTYDIDVTPSVRQKIATRIPGTTFDTTASQTMKSLVKANNKLANDIDGVMQIMLGDSTPFS